MKINVVFKHPNVIDNAIRNHVLSEDEELAFRKFASRFIRYGEYITIHFDTDNETVEVLPA